MTQQKKLKKAIRARTRKTGESYTAARRNVLTSQRKAKPTVSAAPLAGTGKTPVARRGVKRQGRKGEAGVIKRTGHGYDHWFAILDTFGAPARGHTASAAHLYNDHGVPGWHCQMITVEYERERGLRAVNQSCAGDFQVNVSKVVPASLAEVVDALRAAPRRAAWLRGAEPSLRRALEAALAGPKPRQITMRKSGVAGLRYPWDGGAVEIAVMGKPDGRASVVASMTKLKGTEEVEERRAQWKVALEGLKGHLTS
jgi:hypothetical protein